MTNKKNLTASVLTIAGSDSSGGAGIQADLKAFAGVGVHGATVITCVTAQNSKGVYAIEPLSLEIIGTQLDTVLSDLKPLVIKMGMLFSAEIVKLVCRKLREYKTTLPKDQTLKLVLDPVLVSTSGYALTTDQDDYFQFLESLKTALIPLATIITPNLPEASELLGYPITTLDDMKSACRALKKLGPQFVLLKGGHRVQSKTNEYRGKAIDILFSAENNYIIYKAPFMDKSVHGTGCTFASAIAGYLAKGLDIETSIGLSKELITSGIRHSISVGYGVDSVNLLKQDTEDHELNEIILKINNSKNALLDILVPNHLPEVGSNIGYALPEAGELKDVCALTSRLVRVGDRVGCLGKAEFGASKHVGRIILAAMESDLQNRSAMNIKYRPETIKLCTKLGFSIGTFSRKNEPKGTSSMEWGTKTAIEDLGFVPDIIYDTGGHGKEPMIRILGKEPEVVIEKLKLIINN